MATQAIPLEIAPAQLLRRLPRAPGTFLLDGGSAESWGSGEAVLGWAPATVFTCDAAGRMGAAGSPPAGAAGGDPFTMLERVIRDAPRPDRAQPRPMSGAVCALAYDLGRWVERLPAGPADDLGLPVLAVADHPWLLVYNYRDRGYTLRSDRLSSSELGIVAEMLLEAAHRAPRGAVTAPPAAVVSNFRHDEFRSAVQRILAYIAAGDVYQVNLAQRFSADGSVAPAELFARLLRHHPAPYAAYADWGDWALVSNSPECFLECDGPRLATYPIKGTRRRGGTRREDDRLIAALRRSGKDRAEHVMIVDLERNDLGRVCEPGSIRVPALARLRSLPSLHHLESVVCGRRRQGVSMAEILRAIFPGGSITGAPKIRAMEVIDEIEPVARRFYTGAIGLLEGDDWARLNIAIRTAMVLPTRVTYHAGGGIVADSAPDREFEETLLKAQAFLTILEGGDSWERCAALSI